MSELYWGMNATFKYDFNSFYFAENIRGKSPGLSVYMSTAGSYISEYVMWFMCKAAAVSSYSESFWDTVAGDVSYVMLTMSDVLLFVQETWELWRRGASP